ncbi:hypothetical protein MNBD_ACTINO01-1248 [hydrothermal vent metagenome]|uniref:HTH arsR-type domain-containing protein n=1 Tax=hydrothermal vent metagenome TaxID=652676 RepID=A0A3B0R6N7_9ZZZZ
MTTPTGSDTALAAKLFRGFGDRTRLAILVEIADGEQRVTDLVERLGRSQSTISTHVACLRDCGLVDSRIEGRQVFYRVAFPEVIAMLKGAELLLTEIGHEVELCPNYGEVGER